MYDFVPFRLDPAERRLTRDGLLVALTPKCFDLLVVLVENSGHLLEKSDLIARVWPGQFVEEGNLSFNISELRKALGETEDRRFIETVRKKGFRFVAPVQETGPSLDVPVERVASRRWMLILAIAAVTALALVAYFIRPHIPAPAIDSPPRTIAVLPFKPLASNVRDAPLEIGICNALIVRLGSIEQLVVRPTSSVVAFKSGRDPLAAGRQLHVDAVVDGYIERSPESIRVTARLLRTRDGKSLWTGVFKDSFTDIFEVEDSMSRQIAEALHVTLTQDEQRRIVKHSTRNAEAYDLYLKGQYFQDKRTSDGVAKSIDYLEAATTKDPQYALAFAALSESFHMLTVRADAPPKIAGEKARAAAMRAVQIDDSIAEGHAALGSAKNWYEWDWAGAGREFQRARELSPNAAIMNQEFAAYLLTVGRTDEAISAVTHAQRLAPVSVPVHVHAARIFYFAGLYDAAAEECRKAIDMDPDFGGAYLFVGRIETQRGRYREAIDAQTRARALLHDSAETLSLLGYTYAVSGRTADARKILDELQALSRRRYISPYHIAMVEAALGERDEAFRSLDKAYDDREGRLTILRLAPEFQSLRSDPRFADLLRRMKMM